MLEAKLVVVGGDARTALVELQLPCVIGRGREANVVLPHPLVSRRHCELFEQDGVLMVKDLDSLNGTYVNNQRIDRQAELKPDQLLTLGNVTFRAYYRLANEPREGELNGKLSGSANGRSSSPRPAVQHETVYDGSPRGSDTDKNLGSRADASESLEEPTEESPDRRVEAVESEMFAGEEPRVGSRGTGMSSQVLIEDPDLAVVERSISGSALDRLPGPVAASSSFLRQVETFDAQAGKAPLVESEVELDLEDRPRSPVEENSSGLDSFLKRLPR